MMRHIHNIDENSRFDKYELTDINAGMNEIAKLDPRFTPLSDGPGTVFINPTTGNITYVPDGSEQKHDEITVIYQMTDCNGHSRINTIVFEVLWSDVDRNERGHAVYSGYACTNKDLTVDILVNSISDVATTCERAPQQDVRTFARSFSNLIGMRLGTLAVALGSTVLAGLGFAGRADADEMLGSTYHEGDVNHGVDNRVSLENVIPITHVIAEHDPYQYLDDDFTDLIEE